MSTLTGRLAMRVEGDWWVAYYAPPDKMEGAIELGRIAFGAVVKSPAVKQAFIELMQLIFEDAMRPLGLTISDFDIRPGPEHEKAGRA